MKEKIKNFFRNTKDSVCHFFNKLGSALKTFGAGAKDKISSSWIAFIDFWGSLFFLSAIIIALKPELLSPFINQNMSDVSRVTKSFSYAGSHFLFACFNVTHIMRIDCRQISLFLAIHDFAFC